MSDKYRLDYNDIKHAAVNFLLYNVPVWLLSFVTLVSRGSSVTSAAGTASVTLLTALVDLCRKFANGETIAREEICVQNETIAQGKTFAQGERR